MNSASKTGGGPDTRLEQALLPFRSLIQNISDIIIILLREDGTIRWQSPAVERILSLDPSAQVGERVYSWVHVDDAPLLESAIATTRTDPGARPTLELRCRRRDGEVRHVEATVSNLLADPNVGGLVVTMRDITERRSFEDQLARQAFYDPLTGLPNRVLFTFCVEHALAGAGRRDLGVAVLVVDLDRFKLINDSLGHAVGDRLLVEVGRRIRSSLRPGDTVARLGGDGFTILLEDIPGQQAAERVTERLLQRLRLPFHLEGYDLYVTASIGIAVGPPGADDAGELLRLADAAMFRAKTGGKDRYVVFDQSMREHSIARLGLESDLRRALERDELRLHYQPIADLASGQIVGAEALVRWQHPARGLVSPLEFIPVAEETGLTVPIGRWVLRQACFQARAWRRARDAAGHLSISVNLSSRQFHQADLVDQLADALAESELEPDALKLEITESVVIDDAPTTMAKLEALRSLGVALELDDFGTGYSSLSYLRRLPVQTVKLDRSFVSGIGDDPATFAIVQAVTDMAHAIGMEVAAEGIETDEQLELLRQIGCDRGQGYLFARPLTADQLAGLLARG